MRAANITGLSSWSKTVLSPEPDASHMARLGRSMLLSGILSSSRFRSRKAFSASAVHANCSALTAFHSGLTIVE